MTDPNLTSYTGSLTSGANYEIEGKDVVWVQIGSGQFSALDGATLAFSGTLDEKGQNGKIGVSIAVTGEDVGTIDLDITDNSSSLSASGGCTFSESGSSLTVSFTASVNGGSPQPMTMVLETDDDGVEISVNDTELWIGS
jgi:hypothetical protein